MAKKPKPWTENEMKTAQLEHGPEQNKADTYRLSIPGTMENPGKRLDVPGWMVGDPKMAETVIKAAQIIRQRLLDNSGDLL